MRSMYTRRLWAINLANRAASFADEIGATDLATRARHHVAVAYNAMNSFGRAASAFSQVLSYFDSAIGTRCGSSDECMTVRARLMREHAVCMAKEDERSDRAAGLAVTSLDITRSVGDRTQIADALNRACEVMVYLRRPHVAEFYLETFAADYSDVDPHLTIIAKKMRAKHLIALGLRSEAESLIRQGIEECRMRRFFHQEYHFTRLGWHLAYGLIGQRAAVIT